MAGVRQLMLRVLLLCACVPAVLGLHLSQGVSLDDDFPEHLFKQPNHDAYHLEDPSKDSYSQRGQDQIVMNLIDGMEDVKDGFFVESGAFDGERHSNTLSFEKSKGWTGLLVEPVQKDFATLQSKNRNAWLFNGALSISGRVEKMHFAGGAEKGALDPTRQGAPSKRSPNQMGFDVMCAPLETLMRKIGRRTIDFWSLDVEGSEGNILEKTDLNKIEVGVVLIEMNKSGENNRRIMKIMDKYGFRDVGRTKLDRVYANPKYFEARGLKTPEDYKPPKKSWSKKSKQNQHRRHTKSRIHP